MTSHRAAQRRNAIAGFRAEQRRLEELGLFPLATDAKKAIRAYHDEVLHDLDSSGARAGESAEYPVHWGMRLAATAGLFVIVGIVLYMIDQSWAALSNWGRFVLATSIPLVFLFLSEVILSLGRSRYFSTLLAGLSAVAVCSMLVLLTRLFNQSPGPLILLVAGGYGAALGHRQQSIPLGSLALFAMGFGLGACLAVADGSTWDALPHRLEPFLLAGIGLFVVGAIKIKAIPPALAPMQCAWRISGLALAGLALIALGFEGTSLLPGLHTTLAKGWQLAAVLIFPALIITGYFARWRDLFYGGTHLSFLFIIVRLYHWIGADLSIGLKAVGALALVGLFMWLMSLLCRIYIRGRT